MELKQTKRLLRGLQELFTVVNRNETDEAWTFTVRQPKVRAEQTVVVSKQGPCHTCTCRDYRKTADELKCKHIYFAVRRVLGDGVVEPCGICYHETEGEDLTVCSECDLKLHITCMTNWHKKSKQTICPRCKFIQPEEASPVVPEEEAAEEVAVDNIDMLVDMPIVMPDEAAPVTSSSSSIRPGHIHEFLNYAKKHDWVNAFKMLASNPELINCHPPKNRWTALHQAVFSGHREAIDHFVSLGADKTARNAAGHTPAEVSQTPNFSY